MQTYLRDQIDWESAFPLDEYPERLGKVRREMLARGIDTLYVTTPANLTWLTGYDMIWYHLIETLLVTENALEVLSKLPRHLVVVD